jgi:hypothetical protein
MIAGFKVNGKAELATQLQHRVAGRQTAKLSILFGFGVMDRMAHKPPT